MKLNRNAQTSLTLRLLGGGYLAYLSYDLFTSNDASDPMLYAIAAVFGLVGGALVAHSLYKILTDPAIRNPQKPQESENPEDDIQ